MNIKYLYLAVALLFISELANSQSGIIYIKSNPSGARVLINNQETNKTTPFQMTLNTGEYSFRLISEMYQVHEGNFTIKNNSLSELDIALQPNFGSLRISSYPTGADCFIDGRLIGKTPLFKDTILAGERKVALSLKDYEQIEDWINIESQEKTEKIYSLVSNFGTVGVLADPKADIFLNEKLVANHVFSAELKPGVYKFEARKDKYIPQSRELIISKGEEYLLNFDLIPMTGNLFILSNPPEATILLNDSIVGKTPFILNDLLIGNYDILLKKDGFADHNEIIAISNSKTQNLDVALLKSNMVAFKSQTDSTAVYIDNAFKGLTPLILNLAPGNYKLRLDKEGFQNIDTTINVIGNAELFFDLRKNELINDGKTPISNVFITVVTYPNNAAFKISNNDKIIQGNTPARINLLEGEYKLILEKDGYYTTEEIILAHRSKPKILNYDLKRSGSRAKRNNSESNIQTSNSISTIGDNSNIQNSSTEQSTLTQSSNLSKNNPELAIGGISQTGSTIDAPVSNNKINIMADVMPSFPDGDLARMSYLVQNLKYPEIAKRNGIQGKVRLSFLVDPNGNISRIRIIESLGGGCDEEAIRLIQNMPAWNPGTINGKPVTVETQMTISFIP